MSIMECKNMNQNEKFFIELAKKSIYSEHVQDLTIDVDWNYIYSKSEEQCISGLIAVPILEMTNPLSNEWIEKWDSCLVRTIALMSHRFAEFERVTNNIVNKGIKLIALKGSVMKDYYPEPYLRTMGDFDIYIQERDADLVISSLDSLGYEIKKEDIGYSAIKNGVIWEIFDTLKEEFQINTVAYDKKLYDNAIIWKNGIYRLNTNDMLVHLIVHFAKHLVYQGIGIRSILDIALYIRKHKTEIDFNYIKECCVEQGYRNIYYYVLAAINMYFNLKINNEKNVDVDAFMGILIDKGVFGAHSDNIMMYQTSKLEGSIFRRLFFPKLSMMRERYTYLNKYPFLLPCAWIHRIICAKTKYRYKYSKLLMDIKGSVDFAKNRDGYIDKLKLKGGDLDD